MKLEIRNQKNVIAGIAKQSTAFASFVWIISFFIIIAACSDFGDRDNPLDPGAGNYVVQNDDSKSFSSCSTQSSSSSFKNQNKSSSSVILSSGEESSASRSSSSTEKQKFSNSSKISEPAEGSSSSDKNNASSSSWNETIGFSSSSVKTQLSSSSNRASSSSKNSSSSSENPWICGDSTLTGDDYEYKTVVIKEQCWTKENLRNVPSSGHTMCYGDKKENCETYGRLYDYEAASLSCPTGWRIPTSAEYEALAEYSMEGAILYDAGAHFKSTSGWTPENGDDFLEFTALPGGKCNEERSCQNLGTMGYWWTSTEKVKNTSHLVLALNGDGDSYSATNKMDNDQYISVRCVKK